MSAGAPTLECRITGASRASGSSGRSRILFGLRDILGLPGFREVSLGVSRSPGSLGAPRGSPSGPVGVFRNVSESFGGLRGPSMFLRHFDVWISNQFTGSFFWVRSVIGLCQQVHRSVLVFGREVIVWDKFRTQCLRTGMAFVFLCRTYHESIHLSVSRRITDAAHVTLSHT